MQRGQRLADFAARYGLRPVPPACRGFIDFDGFQSCVGSQPVNSCVHSGATDAAVKPLDFPFPPFSLTFGRFFGKMSCRSDCVARTRHSRDLRHSSSRQARDLRTSFGQRCLSVHSHHRTSNGKRCWSDCLFSFEDFLQVDSVARTRHSLDLRSLLIEQHSSLTRYSFCFRKTFLSSDPLLLDSGILDCRHFDKRTALFSEIGARRSTRQIPCKSLSRPPSARTAVA